MFCYMPPRCDPLGVLYFPCLRDGKGNIYAPALPLR